ncbi:MAG: hypothetical protein F6K19_43625 [Cyanothece sp. SIO1E1]|nr:hypothetical protein [Cyanothece sp. SIO1E1]
MMGKFIYVYLGDIMGKENEIDESTLLFIHFLSLAQPLNKYLNSLDRKSPRYESLKAGFDSFWQALETEYAEGLPDRQKKIISTTYSHLLSSLKDQ